MLDPFKVGKGWFRINLPGLQLELTDKVPADQRQLAQDTLDRLHLVNDERLMRWRRKLYRLYQKHKNKADALWVLREVGPLLAQAIEEQQAAGKKGMK